MRSCFALAHAFTERWRVKFKTWVALQTREIKVIFTEVFWDSKERFYLIQYLHWSLSELISIQPEYLILEKNIFEFLTNGKNNFSMNLLLDKRHEVGCTWLHNHQDLMLIDEQIFLKINLNFFNLKTLSLTVMTIVATRIYLSINNCIYISVRFFSLSLLHHVEVNNVRDVSLDWISHHHDHLHIWQQFMMSADALNNIWLMPDSLRKGSFIIIDSIY